MRYSQLILREIRKETKEVILFHSGAGKDSIAMLNMASKVFERIVCVYMYMVEDLEHIERYIRFAEKRYKNCEFIRVPHFTLTQYRKYGHLGMQANPEEKEKTLNGITKEVKEELGIDWAIFGFKYSDSLQRNVMLKTLDMKGIHRGTKNAYPLSIYNNRDVLRYIKLNRLPSPVSYGNSQSQGEDVNSIGFILYCRELFPSDYEKIKDKFPEVERLMFEFDYHYDKYIEEDE